MHEIEYAKVTKPLDQKDFAIILAALNERNGFDGHVFTRVHEHFGVNQSLLSELQDLIRGQEGHVSLSESDALNSFLVCCLASAALGDEELGTVTGFNRNEVYLTIRRLYHAIRISTPRR